MAAAGNADEVQKVELMTEKEFVGHLAGHGVPLAKLNMTSPGYASIERTMQTAIKFRSTAKKALRMFARMAATDTNVANEYNAEVKADTVRKFQIELFKSQEDYLFASLAVTDGIDIASKIISSRCQANLMSASAKMKLEALRSKKVPQ